MLLEISFQEFGNTTKLFTTPIKVHKDFSTFALSEGKKENTELPYFTEPNWINSWELIDVIGKAKETVNIMLTETTKEFVGEVQAYYRPIKTDPNAKFIFNIVDENYHVRDNNGDITEQTIVQIVHTFEIDAGKSTFTMSNLTKNVSKTHIPITLFEKVFNQYFYDYSATVKGQTYPMKGIKNIFEDFFHTLKDNYVNRFTTLR
jgi:hypothetical protein